MGQVARRRVKVRYCRYKAAGSKPGLKLRNAGVRDPQHALKQLVRELQPLQTGKPPACGDRTATDLGK